MDIQNVKPTKTNLRARPLKSGAEVEHGHTFRKTPSVQPTAVNLSAIQKNVSQEAADCTELTIDGYRILSPLAVDSGEADLYLCQSVDGVQYCLLVHSGNKGVQILVRHVLAGITQPVDDAALNLGMRKNCMDRCVKPCQIVGTDDENIFNPSVFQPIQYSCPELGALVFANQRAQDIFPAIQIDPDGNVYCFLHNLPFAADMVVDCSPKYHGIDRFQRPLLPLVGDGQNLVRDPADRAVRDRYAVNILNMGFNIAGGHALGRTWAGFPTQCPD